MLLLIKYTLLYGIVLMLVALGGPAGQGAGQVQLGENRTVLAGRDQKVRGSVRAVGTAPEK